MTMSKTETSLHPATAVPEHARSLTSVRDGIANGMHKAATAVEHYFGRIDQFDGQVNAYLALDRERALAQAAAVDEAAKRGDTLPALAGVPVGIKDVLTVEGMPATAGSRILEHYQPPYTATAVAKLQAAGAIILGKLNCDEFAMGSSNENSAYGPVRNPAALDRVPGGSSGGSAAAVAADMAAATLGTDTGGSIRQPASYCGVVGLLPTYGRISRYGLIAFASSLDRVGPLTHTVEDAAVLLGVLAGHDPMDATSSQEPVPDYAASVGKPVDGLRIGVPAEYFGDGLDPRSGLRSKHRLRDCVRRDAMCSRSHCRTHATRYLPTICWRPRRRVPTWRALMACASAIVRRMQGHFRQCIATRAMRVLALR